MTGRPGGLHDPDRCVVLLDLMGRSLRAGLAAAVQTT
jgi:hypothetical protein